ncbi:BLUF domain-containing protein [Rhodopseudomonas sp. HC1]|uniref:BLUF domain-containing protein n=1 Tax=Rhodopseudomonas infernalis TaxID=2897386 RepID=UPI001EE86506|nr:BLUF domain-containing protein [Rhodopseudomonas infernalis]MCG6205756.1 BLUF domain-containing protein [Rhodopseudomonas infernalis]
MPIRPYRCVYWSKHRIDGEAGEIDAGLGAILSSARRNNRLLGVTGALVFDRGLFAQFLEGEIRAVELVFENIQRDERHGDTQVLSFGVAAERAFRPWPMAFLGRTDEEHLRFADCGDEAGASMRRLEAERLRDLVRTLGDEGPMQRR